jgi:hypothetical protein
VSASTKYDRPAKIAVWTSKRAIANGKKFGRPSKLTPHQRREAMKRRAAGETLAAMTSNRFG